MPFEHLSAPWPLILWFVTVLWLFLWAAGSCCARRWSRRHGNIGKINLQFTPLTKSDVRKIRWSSLGSQLNEDREPRCTWMCWQKENIPELKPSVLQMMPNAHKKPCFVQMQRFKNPTKRGESPGAGEPSAVTESGHQGGNKAKSSNVPLYLKKIKMSFSHPPWPNKGFFHLQSVHSLSRINIYCSRRKGWCCLYKEKSLSCWVPLTHS